MAENLVIVESPAKAKTIEKILGSEYLVKSSIGHIRDLPKKGLGVELDNNFQPTYEVSADKKAIVSELKSLAKKAKTVWLASDEDREGEAIAWHLSEVLGLNTATTKRIVFHEITKNAILNAIKTPRTVDMNLVNAQQARRILDRLVGFELSPVLWRKVKPSLSAGRVQSVTVRLVVEREREIINFSGGDFFKVTALFELLDGKSTHKIKAELNHRFKTEQEAKEFLNICSKAQFSVKSVEKKPGRRSPSAPFTTSTLQQEASRKLGFSVSQTMTLTQRLYEAGFITYMRTDSVNLSADAVAAISGVVTSSYGANYLENRAYKNKNKGAQEAHEAIRPSYLDKKEITGSAQEKRLYDLIWKRSVASQMADAILERTTIDIAISGSERLFVAKGEVVLFDGFLKLYQEATENEEEHSQAESALLPPIKVGEPLNRLTIEATQRFDQRPARYSEASLVKHLEELGIGRPSTYAPTISTIVNRGYVVKEDRPGVVRKYIRLTLDGTKGNREELEETTGAEKSKLFPTDIGMLVNDYLESHFPAILDYSFTAKVEEEFDHIAEGNLPWQQMIGQFYTPFHTEVAKATTEEGGYASSQQRLLGTDPKTGKNVYTRVGRFGPMVQIGESDNKEEKPTYASLRSDQLTETITLEQALELFALPRTVGEFEDKDVVIGIGRFGPYVRHDAKFVSLEKEDNPYTISLARAIELIEDKRKKESERLIKTFSEDGITQLLNGRWGPYIASDGRNYKIPKDKVATELTFEEVKEIMAAQADAPVKTGRFAKRTAKPAAGAKSYTAKKAPAKKRYVKKSSAK